MPGKLTREEAEHLGLIAPETLEAREARENALQELKEAFARLRKEHNLPAPKSIVCDLDGTLALMGERGPFEWHRVGEDTLNEAVADMLRRYEQDHCILIVSGRSDECREATAYWLRQHSINYEQLIMRSAGDFRKDAVVKQELYEAHIKGQYDVVLCLDDRNQSVEFWRSLGLTCFQVAPGDF